MAGAKIFFSRRLCQDPLENFFGCRRQRGGTHDNPTVKKFQQNMQALHVVNSFYRPVVKGNCQGNTETVYKENTDCPLPRRSTKRGKLKLCIQHIAIYIHTNNFDNNKSIIHNVVLQQVLSNAF